MKKQIKILICVMLIIFLSGCMSKEEEQEVLLIQQKSEEIVLKYLERNYNVPKINHIKVRFDDEGSGFGSSFENKTNYTTALFTKNGEEHIIICNYTTEKCYDTYAYETKVNPILINEIEKKLKSYGTTENVRPTFVNIRLENITSYITNDYYDKYEKEHFGIFNYEDNVNTYSDIRNYYNQLEGTEKISAVEILYNTNKIITNNMEAYKKLEDFILEDFVVYNLYSNDTYKKNRIYNEALYVNTQEKETSFESTNKKEIGNYMASWAIEKKERTDSRIYQYQDFEITTTENNNTFANEIELYNKKYYLYSKNTLNVRKLEPNRQTINILHISPCQDSKVVYKDKFGTTTNIRDSYTFDYNESSQQFAIYCPKLQD